MWDAIGDTDDAVRAFLSVQPSIRWCETHDLPSSVAWTDEAEWRLHQRYWHVPSTDCRIVERKLVDAPL